MAGVSLDRTKWPFPCGWRSKLLILWLNRGSRAGLYDFRTSIQLYNRRGLVDFSLIEGHYLCSNYVRKFFATSRLPGLSEDYRAPTARHYLPFISSRWDSPIATSNRPNWLNHHACCEQNHGNNNLHQEPHFNCNTAVANHLLETRWTILSEQKVYNPDCQKRKCCQSQQHPSVFNRCEACSRLCCKHSNKTTKGDEHDDKNNWSHNITSADIDTSSHDDKN